MKDLLFFLLTPFCLESHFEAGTLNEQLEKE